MTDVVKTEDWIGAEAQARYIAIGDALDEIVRTERTRPIVRRAGDANAAQADTIAQLRAALTYHVASETDPCRWDHNGNCQNHGSFNYDSTCQVAEHRALLGLDGDR